MNDAIELMVASRILHDADEFGAQLDDLTDDYTRRYGFHYFERNALKSRLRSLREGANGKGEFQAAKDCDDQLAHMLQRGAEVVVLPAPSDYEELHWLVAEYALESVYNMLCDDKEERRLRHLKSERRILAFKQAVFDEAVHHANVCGLQVAEFTTWLYNMVNGEIEHPGAASQLAYRTGQMDAPTHTWCPIESLRLLCEGLLDIARERSRP